MIPFEDSNVEAYRLLLRIEVALRELLRESLEKAHGARWRRQLPSDLRKLIHENETEETRRKQFGFIRLGPLYYLTLGELLNVFQQAVSNSAVDRIGGKLILEQLANVFAPRNALAHSRDVSQAGLQCVRAIYSQLENSLTPHGLRQYLAKPDVGVHRDEVRPLLIGWLEDSQRRMTALEPSCPLHPAYEQAAQQYWWEMEDVAGFDHAQVDSAADVIREYDQLEKGIGSAVQRQRFVEQRGSIKAVSSALQSLQGIP